MKTPFLLVAASALLASSCAFAQQSRPATSVPPPPGLNDPGVTAVAPASKATESNDAAPAAHPLDLKPQALPAMREDATRAGRDSSLPDIKVRQEGDNSIQEYSRNGRVYMVVITPKSGISQTYMVDPQGRLVDEHGVKPVKPVMYKVLEWGKSRPATEASDAGNP